MYWKIENHDPGIARELADQLGFPPILAGMLVRRGLTSPDLVRSFLEPSLRDLPNPFLLPDMDRAVDRLILALDRREAITVYGDYDADGLTASALLADFLLELGARVNVYIPDRLDEGYGLNVEAVVRLASAGTALLVTVDCGISDFEAVNKARELGIDVIITDHHQIPERLPLAKALVNPHRKESSFPQRELAGVGVAFFLAGGLRQALRERNLLSRAKQPELAPLLGLVAIGTVADVMPLLGINRILVSVGLNHLVSPVHPGLLALKETCSLLPESLITARDVAFKMAPRLNAPGRLGSSKPSLDILRTKDIDQAREYAALLEKSNSQRRKIQEDIFKQALALVEDGESIGERSIVLAREDWPRGVVGLAASKLAERFNRPTILLAIEDGLARGSGRSIKGFNLYRALCLCADSIFRFGGHEQAAGLTMTVERIPELVKRFEEVALQEISDTDLTETISIEAVLNFEELKDLVDWLPRLAPFGQGNPEPVFVLKDMKVVSAGCVGNNHLKLTLNQDGAIMETIGFNLGHMLPELGPRISVAIQRHSSTFRGKTNNGWKVVDIKKELISR